jgi:OOP family OmpA-OmpF porin
MRQLKNFLLTCTVFILLASSAYAVSPPPQPSLATTTSYTQNVDNFQIILDSSLSMSIGGIDDFTVAQNLVRRMNQWIPTNFTYKAGLRNIGRISPQSEKLTDLLYGMTDYKPAVLDNKLAEIDYVGGPSFLSPVLYAAAEDLKPFPGKSALIIFSDGLHMNDGPTTAKNIKETMGENLCIYTVAVGNEDNGSGVETLKQVADASQCGYATTDRKLANAVEMNLFVEKIFISKKESAPIPVPVVAPIATVAPPMDSDVDGVFDDQDLCPDTPQGISIDDKGCPTKLTLMINFANDSNYIGQQYMGSIATAATCINNYPGNIVYIDGHTDSLGSAKYNQKLSKKRALAVTNALIDKFGISASRMTARGFGEDQPIASNKTSEGRTSNRRVEVACGAPK